MDNQAASAAYRPWEIAAVAYHHAPRLLDEGWEPFAVTINGPSNDGAVTVYLRRRRAKR